MPKLRQSLAASSGALASTAFVAGLLTAFPVSQGRLSMAVTGAAFALVGRAREAGGSPARAG